MGSAKNEIFFFPLQFIGVLPVSLSGCFLGQLRSSASAGLELLLIDLATQIMVLFFLVNRKLWFLILLTMAQKICTHIYLYIILTGNYYIIINVLVSRTILIFVLWWWYGSFQVGEKIVVKFWFILCLTKFLCQPSSQNLSSSNSK